jgi:hypothetical protein
MEGIDGRENNHQNFDHRNRGGLSYVHAAI